MPSIKKIHQTMVKQGINDDVLEQFDFTEPKGNNPIPIIEFIDKMDKLLTKEQCLAVMEKQGCCKGGKRDKDCKEFAKENSEKSLTEKLSLMSSIENMMAPSLNDDGTITVRWGGHQNGVHSGHTTCSCGTIMKMKQPFTISSTYCGCCAGHFLYHYQNALEVKLKLKEIVSSPLNTNGEEPCAFTFEIMNK